MFSSESGFFFSQRLQHTFRQPEPRPPAVVSLAFTGLATAPLLLLLVLVR